MAPEARRVRVAVEAVADRPERTFTYLLPAAFGDPQPGSLLLVPYGRRLALGYLMPGRPEDAGSGLKEVEAVVSEPMLTPDLLALAHEIAVYYRAPIGTTLAAMLPPGLESRLLRRWKVDDPEALPKELTDAADADGWISDAVLQRRAPRRTRAGWIEKLRRTGVLRPDWSLRPPEITARRVRTLRAIPGAGEPPRRAPVQRALLDALAGGERTFPELADALGADAGSLLAPARRLAALGLAVLDWRTVERDPLAHRSELPDPRHDLAPEQQRALAAIRELPDGGELLLDGVAASGKTDVYLAAIRHVLDGGESAIVLVPEMSLVPQIGDRLRAALGGQLAVLHSGLSAGERHDEWGRMLRGEARVAVGTRSAAFAPLIDLRLIVVDEEHDGGYKADRTPRYDARWVARRRAQLTGA
ncbi:MAG: DEAD/DEAH box helicase, partial [Chloroflexota bacterium]|nr:DEAD/DEAH box helicase [Chloroflexota bacterium]